MDVADLEDGHGSTLPRLGGKRDRTLGLAAAAVAAVLVASIAAAVCTDGDDDAGGRGRGAGGGVLGAGEDDDIDMAAVVITGGGDTYSYEAPAALDAGVYEIEVTNRTDGEQHVEILRVDGGHTFGDADAAMKGAGEGGTLPDYVSTPGGIGRLRPGQSRSAIVKLTAGTYFFNNPDPSDEQNEASPPFSQLGLVHQLQVTGTSDDDVPEADVVLTARDNPQPSFTLPRLKAGTTAVTFRNAGTEFHHLVAVPLGGGRTVADARTYFESDDVASEAPVDFDAGDYLTALAPGATITTTLDLRPGPYVFACFLSNRAGGPPHFQQGMLVEAVVGS